MRHVLAAFILCLYSIPGISSQEVLRARLTAYTEPVWMAAMGLAYPLEQAELIEATKQEAYAVFSAIIFGWAFEWEPEFPSRGRKEFLALRPLGRVAEIPEAVQLIQAIEEDGQIHFSLEYSLNENERLSYAAWSDSRYRSFNARGQSGLLDSPEAKWEAVEHAAGQAIRALAKRLERNRPRRVLGSISLAGGPRIWISSGQWQVQARFRVKIDEIEGQALW